MKPSAVIADILSGEKAWIIAAKVLFDLGTGSTVQKRLRDATRESLCEKFLKIVSDSVNDVVFQPAQLPSLRKREEKKSFADTLNAHLVKQFKVLAIEQEYVVSCCIETFKEFGIHPDKKKCTSIASNIFQRVDNRIESDQDLREVLSYRAITETEQISRDTREHTMKTETIVDQIHQEAKKIGSEVAALSDPVVQTADDIKSVLNILNPPTVKGSYEDDVHPETYSVWNRLFESCYQFSPNYSHILLINYNASLLTKTQKRRLLALPWKLIIDFDSNSSKDGLFSVIPPENQDDYTLYTPNEYESATFPPFSQRAIWLFAQGMSDRPETLTQDYQSWRRQAQNKLNSFLAKIYAAYPLRAVVLVVTDECGDAVKYMLEQIDLALADNALFQYAMHENLYSFYATVCKGTNFPIRIQDMCGCLARFHHLLPSSLPQALEICVPGAGENSTVIPTHLYKSLSAYFEVLHEDILSSYEPSNNEELDFYRGGTISWYGLEHQYDITRSQTEKFVQRIRTSFKGVSVDNYQNTFYLYHLPGAGGTTMARRIAWSLHEEYPVLVLNNYQEQSIAPLVLDLYKHVKCPIFILVDANIISEETMPRISSEIRALTIPYAILYIQRSRNGQANDKNSRLLGQMDESEFQVLQQRYYSVLKKNNYSKIDSRLSRLSFTNIKQHSEECIPFFFGLTCFEDEFSGVNAYVYPFIKEAKTANQTKILLYIALFHYYAAKSVPAIFFRNMLSLSHGQLPDLRTYFDQGSNISYLYYSKPENNIEFWRPRHYILSKAVIHAILGASMANPSDWRHKLGDWLVRLIEDSSKNLYDLYTDDLLQSLFVKHKADDGVDSSFSKIIVEIPEVASQRIIFETLTTHYKNNAHYLGHFARFYYYIDKDYDKAIDTAKSALSLCEDNDPLLNHIYGMALRSKLYNLIEEERSRKKISADYKIANEVCLEIQELVAEATEQFRIAKAVHGHVAYTQMLIRVVEFGVIMFGGTFEDFIKLPSSQWYQCCIDDAQDQLTEVRLMPENSDRLEAERTKRKVDQCDADINKIYGNLSTVLQNWNNILNSLNAQPWHDRSYACHLRRNIARIYLSRADEQHSQEKDDILNVIKLMEENIEIEPENPRNIRHWLAAVRQVPGTKIDSAIEKLSRWANGKANSLEAQYYLGILHVLKGLEGSHTSALVARELIWDTSRQARQRPDRVVCYEWCGKGTGLEQLIRGITKKEWDQDLEGENELCPMLVDVKGVFSKYESEQSGELTMLGIPVFFIPQNASLHKADVNCDVVFHLGFSYDGLRADINSVRRFLR